jgi:DNA-binding LytR/AlgR family response regulator
MNKVTISLFCRNSQTEKELKACSERFNSLQLKSICHDDVAVIDAFTFHTPDIWFIEVASEKELNSLLEIKPQPPFIVAVSPDNLSVRKLLNRGVFDVLPLDVSMENYCVVIRKISHIINRYRMPAREFREFDMEYSEPTGGNKEHIFISVKNRRCKIIFNKVSVIEKTGSALKIIMDEHAPIYYNSTLAQFLNRLPENIFLRINGSTIVNVNKVENYSKNEILINKAVKKITRQYAKVFFRALEG